MELGEENKYPWFNIDPELYQVNGGRWDTIYSIPVPGSGQVSFQWKNPDLLFEES